jgi:hypothetical protein
MESSLQEVLAHFATPQSTLLEIRPVYDEEALLLQLSRLSDCPTSLGESHAYSRLGANVAPSCCRWLALGIMWWLHPNPAS